MNISKWLTRQALRRNYSLASACGLGRIGSFIASNSVVHSECFKDREIQYNQLLDESRLE